MDEAWAFEHSVECPVTREFAWRFWTDVNNWRLDSDVESVELNGPFAAGSRGVTITRSSGKVEWLIVSVQAETGAVIEVPGGGAVARFRWTFEDSGRPDTNHPAHQPRRRRGLGSGQCDRANL